jgi:2-beta-glucuronyltransferase
LKSAGPKFSRIRIPSKFLASEFPGCENLAVIPHGMDPICIDTFHTSPYGKKKVVVSVGQMLFDPGFFKIASAAFPDLDFHIIGGGLSAKQLSSSNVVIHDEMPYQETLKFLKHASAGVAAYRGRKVHPYLADTSLKLRQFAAFGLPAICPTVILGGYSGRYGYLPDDEASIIDAVKTAIEAGPLEPVMGLGWSQVVEQLIDPNFKMAPASALIQEE